MTSLLLGAMALWHVPHTTAGEPSSRFKHLGVEEGLSSNWVLAIVRDRRGFLWVGTQDGLNRYDGQKFVNYRHAADDPHSIPSPVAGVLFEDSRGRLWVGSRWASNGMALYNRELDRFERMASGDGPSGLSDPRVNAFAEAPGERLWVGTAKGVDLLDEAQGVLERYGFAPPDGDQPPPRLATALLADRKGALWVGTTEGLYLLDREHRRCVPWSGFGDGAVTLDGHRIEALLEDEAGILWAATLTGGLFAIDLAGQSIKQHLPRAGDPTSISHVRTRSLALDGKGRLWVGTENGGLDVLDRRTGHFTHHAHDPLVPGTVSSTSIYALLADRQGLLWIGTYDSGLDVLSPAAQRFSLVTASPGGLRDARVSALLEDRTGRLWIGTDGGGVCRVDPRGGQYTCEKSDPDQPATLGSDSVLTLAETEDGTLWMGGWGGGLTRFDPMTGKLRRFQHRPDDASSLVSDDVWKLRPIRSGELLVATRRGTDVFDPRTGRSLRLSSRYPGVVDDMSLTVAEGRDGALWIGQSGLVQHVGLPSGTVTSYVHDGDEPSPLPQGQVFVIFEDSRGNVWIGGEGGLRCLLGSQPVGSDLVTIEGLPHRVVTNVLEDSSGNLWVTTHRGLTKLVGAVADPAHPAALHFDVHDGLQGSEFTHGAALKARDGRLFFGGPRGYNAFLPEAITLNPEPPAVVLTDLRVFNRPVLPGVPASPLARSITETRELSLSQDHFVVTFEFAALNLILPQKNRYAYRLEGLERDFNEAGSRREATYTQLRRGDYVFHVRAANNDGVWNQAGLALRLHVEPRWHEVTSTRVLLVLLGLGLVLGGVGWRLRQFARRERLLTRRVEERTHALHELNEQLEHRVAERTVELEEETERLSVTLRSIGDAVIATDEQSRVRLMNRVAEQLTGVQAGDVRGRKLGEVMPRLDPITREPRPDPVSVVPGPGLSSSLPTESLLARADGRELTIAENAAPIRDHNGRTLGVVMAFRDVTGQRKLEEQLINNQKLEALGILAGGIAHDFNNLLTGVFGYLELARLESTRGRAPAETLNKAAALIDKARGLTGQLLTFAKGGVPVSTPLRLGEQLHKSVDFALSGSNVVGDVHIDAELWTCRGDRRQIDQVFDNLLLNARQAMPEGGKVSLRADNVTVETGSGLPLPAGRYLRVVVQDQGPGIPKDIQTRIFEPFFTTKSKGTGLGLATVHSIVRKHHGHLEVASPPGQGACFTVYLPASQDAAESPTNTVAATAARACRILVMDDEPHVREVFQNLLSALGHATCGVADGQAAVAAFERDRDGGRPFDLVILDLTIPGGFGGCAVVTRLRQIDPDLRAIAMSGYSADPAMSNPRAHGFTTKLTKPCTSDDLARAIKDALGAAG